MVSTRRLSEVSANASHLAAALRNTQRSSEASAMVTMTMAGWRLDGGDCGAAAVAVGGFGVFRYLCGMK